MMSYKREWLKNETKELISVYHSKPVLWDVGSKYYKSRIKKRHAWIEMAKHFNTTCEEIYRKIHNLRNQFNSEHKKLKMMKTNDDTFELTVSKWPYYESLSFLQKNITLRTNKVIKQSPEKSGSEHSEFIINQNLNEEPKIELETTGYFEVQSNSHNAVEVNQKLDMLSQINESSTENIQHSLRNSSLGYDEDQYAIFGNYIASEMRNLSSDYLRKKMKRKIQQIMFEISQEEEELFAPNNQ